MPTLAHWLIIGAMIIGTGIILDSGVRAARLLAPLAHEPPPPRPGALFRDRRKPLREGRELGDRPFRLRGLGSTPRCVHIKKLRHVAPLRRMQGIIFRGADKLPERSAESAHSNRGAFLQSHQYRWRAILLIERFRI